MPSMRAALASRAMYCASALRRTRSCRYSAISIGHYFERQSAALVLAVQPDDMKTVARHDRFWSDRTGLKRNQGILEFRSCLAWRDLTEIAALRSR